MTHAIDASRSRTSVRSLARRVPFDARLLKDRGAELVVAVVAQNVGNFGFHAIAGRILGPASYGALGAILTLTVTLSVPLAALQVATTRAIAENRTSDARPLIARVAWLTAAAGVLVVASAPFVGAFLHLGSFAAAALIGPYVTFAALASVMRGVAVGRSHFRPAATSLVDATVARLALGTVLTLWIGLTGAVTATALAEVVGAAVVARSALRRGEAGRVTLSGHELGETIAVTGGVWLLGAVDVLLARHYLTGVASGLYVAAGTAARALLVLPQALVMVAMPAFVAAVASRHGRSDERRILLRVLGAAVAVVAIGGAPLAFLGGHVLAVVFGHQYAASAGLLALLTAATLPTAVASVLATYGLARHSPLALAPWLGTVVEIAAIVAWHSTARSVATAALVGGGAQLLIAAVVLQHELRRTAPGAASTMPAQHVGPDGNGTRRIVICNWRDSAHPAAGGAEVYAEAIARRWSAAGHDVTLVCASVDGHAREEWADGVRIVRGGGRFSVYCHARRYVASRDDVDLVLECVNTKPFGIARRCPTTPVVTLTHQLARDVWFSETPLPVALLGRFVLEPIWLRRMRDVPTLTISPSSRESLVAAGLRSVRVVPVGVDQPCVDARAVAKAPVPTVVFCGRLVRSKRPHDAIRAFAAVRRRWPRARLVVIGGGPLEDKLRRAAGPGVDLIGRVPGHVKQALMAEAHALVVTSVREGWGLVVSEAAALGTPAVGYDVPGLRDSVVAGGGRLCRPDPDALGTALVDALEEWLAHPPAPVPSGGARTWDVVADEVLTSALAASTRTPVSTALAPPATEVPVS